MPRISANAGVQSLPIGEAIESTWGDDLPHDRTFRQAGGFVLDLAGAALTATVENYTAAVTVGTGRKATLAVSDLEPIPGATLGAATVTNPGADGTYTVRIGPDAIPGVPNPSADSGSPVVVSIVYVRASRPDLIRTARFMVIWRRGLPI